jgi:hypothetical protein
MPVGVNKHGQPVFAAKGHRTVYEVPDFQAKARRILPP